MAINPKEAISSAIKSGEVTFGDGQPVIKSGDATIRLIESDSGHAGFDEVEINKGGEVARYQWNNFPGLFKELNDFVGRKKTIASGGVSSDIGSKRERKVSPIQLPVSARERSVELLSPRDVLPKYRAYCREQDALGDEILTDLAKVRNKDERKILLEDLRQVAENFKAILDVAKRDPVCLASGRGCEMFYRQVEEAEEYFWGAYVSFR